MNIILVRVQEVAMAEHEVDHGVFVSIGLFGVAAEHVVDSPSVVEAGRNLTGNRSTSNDQLRGG
jgi:hypothetical protein